MRDMDRRGSPIAPTACPPHPGCLEWLPSSDSPDSSSCPPRSLVIILPWMWASRAALLKQATLYRSLGCDVAILRSWPALSVWVPALARRNAAVLLSGLAAHLAARPRPVLLVCFSGAAKGVLAPLLDSLAPAPPLPPAPPPPGNGPAAGGSPSTSGQPAATPQPPAAAPRASRGWWWRVFARKGQEPGPAQQQKPRQQQQRQQASSTSPQAPPPAVSSPSSSTIPQDQVASPPPPPTPGCATAQPPAAQAPQPQPPPRSQPAALLRSCLAGVIFESGPVDFDSSVGVRLFATSKAPWLRVVQAAAGGGAAGGLDFFLLEAFEAQRRQMWHVLRHSLAALRLPVLFMYAWSGDALADPQPIHALAVALRSGGVGGPGGGTSGNGGSLDSNSSDGKGADGDGGSSGSGGGGGDAGGGGSDGCALAGSSASRGVAPALAGVGASSGAGGGAAGSSEVGLAGPRPAGRHQTAFQLVREQAWAKSGHVAHLRDHPREYRAAVEAFLGQCLLGRSVASRLSSL